VSTLYDPHGRFELCFLAQAASEKYRFFNVGLREIFGRWLRKLDLSFTLYHLALTYLYRSGAALSLQFELCPDVDISSLPKILILNLSA
jgi:hypothetical protein